LIGIPDKFEAVDPVSGNPWKCEMVTFGSTPQAPSRQTYLKMNEVNPGGHEMMSHVQPEIARALIQYGRDLERAECLKILERLKISLGECPEEEMVLSAMDEIVVWCGPRSKDVDDAFIPEDGPEWCPECQDHVHELPCGRCISIGDNLPIGWDRNL